jgi:Protein of unknown function (DUF3611)
MSNREITPSTSQASAELRSIGWIGFWLQLILAVVSTLIFLFAIPAANMGVKNPGTGGSLLFAVCGLLALYVSIYWFFNYVSIGRKLKNPDLRPKKADTIKALRWGLIISSIGMGLTILGAESIAGTLLGKSLAIAQPFAVYSPDTLSKIIQPLDIFIVLANTHTITAHFLGLIASLWLLNRTTK